MAELARKEGNSPGIKTKRELKTRAGIMRASVGAVLGGHRQGGAVGLGNLGLGFTAPVGTRNKASGSTKPGVVSETYLQARLFRVTFLVKRWARIEKKKMSTLCSNQSAHLLQPGLWEFVIIDRAPRGLGFKFTLPCFPCLQETLKSRS